jgi:hypothetical protein
MDPEPDLVPDPSSRAGTESTEWGALIFPKILANEIPEKSGEKMNQ